MPKHSPRWFLRVAFYLFIATSFLYLSSWLAGCASGPLTKREKGALIGGAGGAAVGALIGKDPAGALIGGAAGALGGALVGDQLQKRENVDREQWYELEEQRREIDRQRRELERQKRHNQYKRY
ncbi:MAG: hypothetical protein G01um101470_55 [Parcubacteria group bacterium Gr01-1014_70]|nr:MAG: hypothetical protein G01um101470_55 [Parcubacteria group bacterium Gr01-1014_70]